MKELLTWILKNIGSSRWEMLSQNDALSKFLILTTNYRKLVKILVNSLKDVGKWAQFYKAAVV